MTLPNAGPKAPRKPAKRPARRLATTRETLVPGGDSRLRDVAEDAPSAERARPTASASDADAHGPSAINQQATWGVLVYLAGDTEWGASALQADLDEILKTGSSNGRVDSGGTTALLDFLRWGLTQCRSERIALLIGSPYSAACPRASAVACCSIGLRRRTCACRMA